MARSVYPSAIAVGTEAEVVRHVFKDVAATAHTDDEMDALVAVLNGVSAAIEGVIGGPVIRRSFTEKYDGGVERIFLRQRPVYSITSLTENGVSLTEFTHYYLYKPEGIIRRAPVTQVGWPESRAWPRFYNLPQTVEVTYVAGRAMQTGSGASLTAVAYDDPRDEAIRTAALIWIHETWSAGPANLSNLITEAGGVIRPAPIPPQAARLLEPYRTPRIEAV